ncbi:tyrosine-type recombinase/integrase [Lentzea sp. NPDC058450]|uniref:tyrosine-type recombinase/integrase n=1 Tax=Lentzea sp. NPDC058450 TaxID=3346505 RepID=UPI0036627D1C
MLKRRHKATSFPNGPIFPDALGGLRDPSNTRKDLRKARGGDEFAWVTSHVFRKTAATILDESGLSARQVADQLGHARPSMTQDTYMGRKTVDRRAADALEGALGEQ